jgi:hypothetical protein
VDNSVEIAFAVAGNAGFETISVQLVKKRSRGGLSIFQWVTSLYGSVEREKARNTLIPMRPDHTCV